MASIHTSFFVELLRPGLFPWPRGAAAIAAIGLVFFAMLGSLDHHAGNSIDHMDGHKVTVEAPHLVDLCESFGSDADGASCVMAGSCVVCAPASAGTEAHPAVHDGRLTMSAADLPTGCCASPDRRPPKVSSFL
jgi:hypothetical protein